MNPHIGSKPVESVLEIAHVLFMDIVSYSVLPTDKQILAIQQLQKLVRFCLQSVEQHPPSDQVIILPTGDGMALAFFRDLLAPLHCARHISLLLQADFVGFAIRMGVHSGPIYRHADINANANVAGSGINLAQRVMDCGDGGHILISKAVADVLLQLSEWKTTVHELGVIEVKHGVRIEVFNIFDEVLGNPLTPSKFKKGAAKAISERALDIAMGREIPIHEPTELVALVRTLESQGLKGILEMDPDFTVAPEDVRSKPLSLAFPLNQAGLPGPLDLTVTITSPDFEPPSQSKCIRVEPLCDSDTCTFLLTPRQLGDLRVNVDLYSGDVTLFSRLLKTRAMTSDRLPSEQSKAILTIPLIVNVQSPSAQGILLTEEPEKLLTGDWYGGYATPPAKSLDRVANYFKQHVPKELLDAFAIEFPEAFLSSYRVASIPLVLTSPFIWTASVMDKRLFDNSEFYLAVSANLSAEDIISKVTNYLRVAAPGDLDRCIRQAVPGVGLRHVSPVPAAIAAKLNYEYFKLDQYGMLWDRIVSSQRLAVFTPLELNDPKIELLCQT